MNQKQAAQELTECRCVEEDQDSLSELFSGMAKCTRILEGIPEDATLEQFKEAFDEARKIDPRSPYFYIREYKERFTPEMIAYAQSFFKREI
jgi:hypothetical protein